MMPLIFFLNGELHRREKVIKSQNWIVAWNFPREKRMQYNLVHTERNYQKAFKTSELSTLLKYPEKKLKMLIERKLVNKASGRAYAIGTYRPGPVYWSEDDVLELRNRLYELAPKKDGYPYGHFRLVSEAELRSVFNDSPAYYIKNEQGDLVKVWKAFT